MSGVVGICQDLFGFAGFVGICWGLPAFIAGGAWVWRCLGMAQSCPNGLFCRPIHLLNISKTDKSRPPNVVTWVFSHTPGGKNTPLPCCAENASPPGFSALRPGLHWKAWSGWGGGRSTPTHHGTCAGKIPSAPKMPGENLDRKIGAPEKLENQVGGTPPMGLWGFTPASDQGGGGCST